MKINRTLTFLGVFAVLAIAPAVSVKAADHIDIPVPVRTVRPIVPWDFARTGGSEVVTVTFTVDEKGSVQNPVVVNVTHGELKRPVLAAISQWRFKPAVKNGTAIPMLVTVPVKFGSLRSE